MQKDCPKAGYGIHSLVPEHAVFKGANLQEALSSLSLCVSNRDLLSALDATLWLQMQGCELANHKCRLQLFETASSATLWQPAT